MYMLFSIFRDQPRKFKPFADLEYYVNIDKFRGFSGTQMSDLSWVLPLRTETLTNFFSIFPLFANEKLYLILIALGYWAWDKKTFKDFAILVCTSTMLNYLLKILFHISRPNIEHLVPVVDPFSFPSGDIQVVATFWFALAWHFKHPLLWAFSISLVILVGMSRVYLGVHYPIDVIAGAIIGTAVPVIYYWIKNTDVWDNIKQNDEGVFLIFFVLMGCYLFGVKNNFNTTNITASGLLLGIFIGSYLDAKFCNQKTKFSLKQRIAAGIFGLVSMFALRTVLIALWHQYPQYVYLFGIYTLLGIHIIFFVPWLILK